MKDIPVRIPRIKYERAKAHQQMILQKHNLHLPLWKCLLDTENEEKPQPDPFRKMRRGFRL